MLKKYTFRAVALACALGATSQVFAEDREGLIAEDVDTIFAAVSSYVDSSVNLLEEGLPYWQGDLERYQLQENGDLEVLPNSRYLSTKELYGDFIFHFEFRLTPGANNGIGVRVPEQGGDPAYAGMEIQVLDDTADKYSHLKDWQFHGGLYGIQAAVPDQLLPVGEWNSQTIILDGRELRVILNGVLIQNVNLDEVEPIDGKNHPGLERENGRIVLCGHKDPLTYRNMHLVVLDEENAEAGE